MSPVAAFKSVPDTGADEVEDIFQEHYRLVYRTAYTVTGSAHEAEDVLQTVFLQLLRRGVPPGFRKNPKAYLYRAAVNQALNAVRSQRRRAEVFDQATLERALDVPGDDSATESEEIQKRLVKALATLSQRAVEMVILRYEQKYSEGQIATLFGTSRSVVAVTLWRARARLRKLLGSTEVDR
jgi:RNA polymerase sigma-70 factor (ECF subfamily)